MSDAFLREVKAEALRLASPWGSGKVQERTPAEWGMALVGEACRAGAALRNGRVDVARRCLVAAAALCANWYARLGSMR